MMIGRKIRSCRYSVRAVVGGALTLVVVLALAACGGSSSSSETSGAGSGSNSSSSSSPSSSSAKKLKNIAVQMYARDNPFFAEIVSGINYQAKKDGVEVTVQYAENNPVQEVNEIETAIGRHPEGMIVSPIDEHAIVPPVRKAHEAGIPTVIITDSLAPEGNESIIGYVGSQYEDTGRMKAEYIAKQLHGKGEVGVVHLIRGLDFTEDQWKGAEEVFAKYPGIKVVGQLYAGGASSDLGLNDAENLLTAHPNLSALYVDNDPLAIGVIKAVEQRHIEPGKIVIVGGDGTPEGLEAIQAGKMNMTVNFCGFAQGVLALESLQNYVEKNEKPTKHSPQIEITKSNVSKYLKPVSGCSAA